MDPNLTPQLAAGIRKALYVFKQEYDNRPSECKPILAFLPSFDYMLKSIRLVAAQLGLASFYISEADSETLVVFYLENLRPEHWKEWRQFIPQSYHLTKSFGVGDTQEQSAGEYRSFIVEDECYFPVKYTVYDTVSFEVSCVDCSTDNPQNYLPKDDTASGSDPNH